MSSVNWTVGIQVDGGAPVTGTAEIDPAEGVGTVQVTVDPGASDLEADIQPGAATAIQVFSIMSDYYGPEITYKVSDGGADSAPVTLDAPQIFSGGNIVLFGVDPKKLKLSNSSTTQTAKVKIFVARDATP